MGFQQGRIRFPPPISNSYSMDEPQRTLKPGSIAYPADVDAQLDGLHERLLSSTPPEGPRPGWIRPSPVAPKRTDLR